LALPCVPMYHGTLLAVTSFEEKKEINADELCTECKAI
jgi:hypothetical protein